MKQISKLLLSSLIILSTPAIADANKTHRTPHFQNQAVSVWETVIYSGKDQDVKMHRHDHDRVVIALTDGVLKVTNNKGQTHDLKLEKGKSYFLEKDVINETHSDENTSGKPIKVIVVELKK